MACGKVAAFRLMETAPCHQATCAMPESATFSDYLVFVDESGDHSLTSIDSLYPVFVLAFAAIRKSEYVHQVSRDLQVFKMRHWGHDETVLHEHEIRKPRDAFSFLLQKKNRERFMDELTDLMEHSRPPSWRSLSTSPPSPSRHAEAHPGGVYDYAMEIGMRAVFSSLTEAGQADSVTPVIVERRGRREDAELELSFRRICDASEAHARPISLELVMVPKTANSTGLQLADLIARPIGLHHLRPGQPNRAFEIIRSKLRCSPVGEVDGYGLFRVT